MDDYWLWHLSFGHIHFDGMKILQKNDMVKGFPLIKEPTSTCGCCIHGKKYMDIIPKGMSERNRQH